MSRTGHITMKFRKKSVKFLFLSRPTMGGPGMPQVPRGDKGGGGGTMGILMPLYTTGIVIFFVYTLMKIMMKKNDESTENVDDRPSRRLHQQLRLGSSVYVSGVLARSRWAPN